MSKQLVSDTSYDYKWLKQKYPNNEVFYYEYYGGGYLNASFTEYFDENKNSLEIESHGHYG